MITVELLVEALANADWLIDHAKGKDDEAVVVGDCDGMNIFNRKDLQELCDEMNKRIVK